MQMIRYNLSPSMIGRYFYHNCERYLRYHATPEKERRKLEIPDIKRNHNFVTKALLDAGIKWEANVVSTKIKNEVLIPNGYGPINERSFSIEDTILNLQGLKIGDYIYQPTLKVPKTFMERYDLNKGFITFPPCKPDLIKMNESKDGRPQLQILDVKAAEKLTASHTVQTTLYALMLRDIISEIQHKELTVDCTQAGIWLYEHDEPEMFDMDLSIKIVEDFLNHHLKKILEMPIQDVSWHIQTKCEMCEFYEFCKQEAEDTNSISCVPYISVEGKQFFKDIKLSLDIDSVNSINDLDVCLHDPRVDTLFDNCGNLRSRSGLLKKYLQALNSGNVVFTGGTSLELPINENVAVFMTLQKEPISGKIYTAAFMRNWGKEIYIDNTMQKTFVAKRQADCEQIQNEFLASLYRELKILHDYNTGLPWNEQKSLQVYVFDSYELELFNKLLREAVNRPEIASVALKLLFYFQESKLFDGEVHPASHPENPVVILKKEIEKVIAMPIKFFYRLPEVSKILYGPNFQYSIEPNSLFWFDLSNMLKSESILFMWNGSNPNACEWIDAELKRRLLALSGVLGGLRSKTSDKLVKWPPKFQLPGSENFKHPELSKLHFITRYESYISSKQQRENRAKPWENRLREGISIPIEYMGADVWKLCNPIDISFFEQYESYSYLMVPDGTEGEKLQLNFNDYSFREKGNSGKNNLNFAMILDKMVDPKDGNVKYLRLKVESGNPFIPLKSKDVWILHPRYTDFTSRYILQKLKNIDSEEESDFINLLRDPHTFADGYHENEEVIKVALESANGVMFTDSQRKAFDHMLKKRLTLVWGPPGTGKTYFLAQAILCLIKARKNCGLKTHIGITAFTHAAIENLLLKIQWLQNQCEYKDEVQIYKLKTTKTELGKKQLQAVLESDVYTVSDAKSLVLGGTVYSFRKTGLHISSLDLLIVDEASQMKPGELALSLSIIDKSGGLVLAGDDLQLSPILAGDYTEDERDIPGLEDSIFAYLRSKDKSDNTSYTCQLLENWRMNSVLSLFPANTLYGSKYKPANQEISNQRLNILPFKLDNVIENVFFSCLLDSEYPLIVCVLEDVRATLKNEIESEIVSKTTLIIRNHLVAKGNTEPYPDDKKGDFDFWKSGMFIVSPHHAQIRSIKQQLFKAKDWKSPPFVDTVDKMQGQESEVVIVSYGVSDVETALNEADFIYNLNRLNVSTTRARSKCIVFIPRPLFQPPVEIMKKTKAKGLNHMLDLLKFCEDNGDSRTFILDFLESADITNVTVLRAKFPN